MTQSSLDEGTSKQFTSYGFLSSLSGSKIVKHFQLRLIREEDKKMH